uniref:Putative secreted peptide n=1 Tax=Anopheles braziliensis TaxID=58242 RepID=A0A2M3ZXI0_9DIPT
MGLPVPLLVEFPCTVSLAVPCVVGGVLVATTDSLSLPFTEVSREEATVDLVTTKSSIRDIDAVTLVTGDTFLRPLLVLVWPPFPPPNMP